MANFAGQLRSNEIFSALYNMIISQEVFADNLGKHQTLVDKHVLMVQCMVIQNFTMQPMY